MTGLGTGTWGFERYPTLPDILEALDAGRLVHFTDFPEDPRQYVLTEEIVRMRRTESGGFHVTTEVIFHDGSTMASYEAHETDDAAEEIAALLNRGLSVTLQ